MADLERVTELAEAVADGRPLDWSSVESSSADPVQRAVIAKLRIVHSIHGLMTTKTIRRAEEAGRTVLSPGDTWGSLEVRDHVGRGRFGDVYRAWDPALDREVALKLVRHADREDDAETRVVDEGRLMARVRHPNVVAIYGAQRIEGVSGLWMELVVGRTLAAELAEKGPFEAGELIRVGAELARALDAVHRAGLVHRDVKAQNVLRERGGRIVLGDFGTGLELDEPDEARGGLAGTPAYLAPEIFARKPATPQSDLYSLGAVLFQLATGQHAVPGRSLRELRDAHALGTRGSIDTLRPDFPEALRRVIARALDPDPPRRYGTGAEMAMAIEAAMASPASRLRRLRPATVAALLATTVGIALYAIGRPGSSNPVADSTAPSASTLVLVTDFENLTGDTLLDNTLEFALERELSVTSPVQAVSRLRVEDALALMRRPRDTRLDVDVGREVALRDGGIRALVAGRVEKVGESFALSAEVRQTSDGVLLAAMAEPPVPHGAILEAVARLAVGVRRRLGETMATGAMRQATSLPRVTTSSLRALQTYAQVTRMMNDEGAFMGREREAERLLREAVADDPSFAAAYRLLSIVVRVSGERDGESRLPEALQLAERAVALSSTTSPAERVRSEAQWHWARFLLRPPQPEATGHLRSAIAACEAQLRMNVEVIEALSCLRDLYQQAGTPNAAVAIRLAEQLPKSARALVGAAIAILSAQPEEAARARTYLRRAAELPASGPYAAAVARARLFDAHDAWIRNQPGEALRIADQLATEMATMPVGPRTSVAGALWSMYLDLGQFDRARHVLAQMEPPTLRRSGLAIIASFTENPAVIEEVLAREYPKIEEAGNVASTYFEAGLIDESRRLIAAHRAQTANRPPGFSQYLQMLEGNLALIEGRPDAAVESFERFLEDHGSRQQGSRQRRVKRLLGDALAARGDVTRAIQVLESASPRNLDAMGWPLNGQAEWLQIRDRLARLYRHAGRDRDAEVVEAELRTLLAFADDDHPIRRRLDEAAARR